MKKHTLKEWMIAVRPWSFPASAMPVVVTLAMLFWMGKDIDWYFGIWALLNMILFQAAGNVWSDYFDYKHGVDAGDTFGSKTLTGGMFTSKEIYRLGLFLLIAAVIFGLAIFVTISVVYVGNGAGVNFCGIIVTGGWPVLIIGAIGTLLAVLYPFLKFNALGDLDIFLCYAVLPTLGTSYVATGEIVWDVLLIALPVGFITVAILHANNTRDIPTDARAKINTFAMMVGRERSVFLYCVEIISPFGWVTVCAIYGFLPLWSLLVLPTILPAVGNIKVVSRFLKEGPRSISDLDERTAKLQLMFGFLFAVSFILASVM